MTGMVARMTEKLTLVTLILFGLSGKAKILQSKSNEIPSFQFTVFLLVSFSSQLANKGVQRIRAAVVEIAP